MTAYVVELPRLGVVVRFRSEGIDDLTRRKGHFEFGKRLLDLPGRRSKFARRVV